jgi:hypothetical protein
LTPCGDLESSRPILDGVPTGKSLLLVPARSASEQPLSPSFSTARRKFRRAVEKIQRPVPIFQRAAVFFDGLPKITTPRRKTKRPV